MSNSNTVRTQTIAQLLDSNSDSGLSGNLDNEFISVISKHYNSDVDTFIKNYSTIRYNESLVDSFILSYNALLDVLQDGEYVTLSDVHKNGVRVIDSVSEGFSSQLSETTLANFKRKRVVMDNPVNIKSIFDSELLSCEQNEMPFETFVAIKYLSKQTNAVKRGIVYTLTLTDMKSLLKKKKCFYSGIELQLKGDHHLTLDRIDSTKGYENGNVVVCSDVVNEIKNKLFESKEWTKGMTNAEIKKMLLKFIEVC